MADSPSSPSAEASVIAKSSRRIGSKTFALLVLVIVALGIVRSAIATRLDGFTLDEAYHIAAGTTYVKTRDFRLNPEHPPLVKLWVGVVMAATHLRLEPLRQFADKPDEREFTEDIIFLKNDPDSVQRRARAAMFALNGLLLIALAFALRRAFDGVVALGALLFLVIDPTVAAHWPVVMTDLPVAFLSATAIVLATQAFRDWKWTSLFACSAFLGLDLAAKHSAPVVFLSVALIGIWFVWRQQPAGSGNERSRRLLKIAAVLAGALAILWAFYFFRYSESRSGLDSFNRPLADKIDDVNTPFYHSVLTAMRAAHIVPRAYLWGFADTIHAGMEGRLAPQLVFGKQYDRKAPLYFFPAIIAVKVPIGLGLAILLGLMLFFARRLPAALNVPAGVVLAAAILFLLVLLQGATYAGIRHALPVVVLLSIFAGLFVERAAASDSRSLKLVAVAAVVGASISAIPVLRPWEYFNEFVGGTKNAYRYFDDEGVDLGQRTKEIADYYHANLKSPGEIVNCIYISSDKEFKARNVDCFGSNTKRDLSKFSQTMRTGTFFASGPLISPHSFWDRRPLREAAPATRFGNMFVYQGTLDMTAEAAVDFYFHGIGKVYADKPDLAAGEQAFRQSAQLDPTAFFVNIELGNLLLKHGAREEALAAYTDALKYAPNDQFFREPIEQQIKRFASLPTSEIPPLRNPFLE